MRIQILVTILSVVLVSGAGCISSDSNKSPSPSPSTGGATNMTASKATDLKVAATDTPPAVSPGSTKLYGWSPATASGKVNDTINFILTSASTNRLTHNLYVEGMAGKNTATIAAGASANITVTFSKAGTYHYYCAVGGSSQTGHRALGMDGVLTIG